MGTVTSVDIAGIRAARAGALDGALLERLPRYYDDIEAAFWGWNDIWLDPRFAAWDIRPLLENISAPILVIQGDNDEYGTIAQIESIEASASNSRSAMLHACRHAPHRDQRDTVLSLITAFVRNDVALG
jgi:pimeloyl-ACP methyl ester carboxylesterase